MNHSALTDQQLIDELKRAGGSTHGPIVETVSIPLDAYLRMQRKHERDIAALESLRPLWAQGYTSDSVAAQCASSALASIWAILKVDNQTETMQKLRQLLGDQT